MSELILPAINLSILLSILIYFLRAPVKKMARDRHANIKSQVLEATESLGAAKLKYEEYSSKLFAVQSETDSLLNHIKSDAEKMSSQLLSNAKQVSGTIVADSKVASRGLFEDFQKQVQTDFGLKVVKRAEELLSKKMTGDQRMKIQKDFSNKLVGAK